jgi:cytochrome d ubiquinol oxidase subunit I
VSGIFVVCANAWMNTPAGFRIENGQVVDIDPVAAMLNPAAFQQTLHMTIAAYLAIAFVAIGIHAYAILRGSTARIHRRALEILLPIAAVAALLQPISGDLSAKQIAKWQPAKLAAMEGHWETQRGAPLRIGGIPDARSETTRWAIRIPKLLSILAFGNPDAEVLGLRDIPRDQRPPVVIPHFAFQIMVGSGVAMLGTVLLGAFLAWRRRAAPHTRGYLKLLVLVSPLGLIAIEAGWIVTEVGRQPWIVYGIMRTADAVTPMRGVVVPLMVIAAIYLLLGIVVIQLLRRQVFGPARDDS